MRQLMVSEFMSLDGVMQAPGGKDEDRDGGFAHGGWTWPYWDDAIGAKFGEVMQSVDALLLGRRTYTIHAEAFAPDPANDPFGNAAKYVVSKTLRDPIWQNTTIIADDDVVGAIRALKASPGKDILTDGSSQLVHTLLAHDLIDHLHLLVYPVVLGGGKRVFPEGVHTRLVLKESTPYKSGVVGLLYGRA